MKADRTILVVGAGAGQLPAIETAQRLGWRTVTVDRSPNAPGMAVADSAHVVDVTDFDGVLAVARAENIDGAMTMQSDLPVPTVGFVNQSLGLPGVNLEVARTCSRKHLARARWLEAGVPQPRFEYVTDLSLGAGAAERIGFPCVVKAPDSSGSRGVVKVSRREEMDQALTEAAAYSRVGGVLIEEFVPGLEIGAQTFSRGGRCELVLLHNDTVSAPPYMVPTGHSYPFRSEQLDVPELERSIARAVEALGIADGPSNVDLIVGDDGRPMLIEIGARIGATSLPELTSLFTGLDWVEATLRTAVGEVPDLEVSRYLPSSASIIESPSDGVLVGFDIAPWISEHPDVVALELSAKAGDEVRRLRKGTDRIGSVLVKGSNLDEAEALNARVLAGITVLVE